MKEFFLLLAAIFVAPHLSSNAAKGASALCLVASVLLWALGS